MTSQWVDFLPLCLLLLLPSLCSCGPLWASSECAVLSISKYEKFQRENFCPYVLLFNTDLLSHKNFWIFLTSLSRHGLRRTHKYVNGQLHSRRLSDTVSSVFVSVLVHFKEVFQLRLLKALQCPWIFFSRWTGSEATIRKSGVGCTLIVELPKCIVF